MPLTILNGFHAVSPSCLGPEPAKAYRSPVPSLLLTSASGGMAIYPASCWTVPNWISGILIPIVFLAW